jgi:hypothetical protein
MPRIILEGARNVLGPSGIFWEETVAENILSQREGTRSHDLWAVLLGCPLWGAAHVWWIFGDGASVFGGACLVGVGPPMGGAQEVAGHGRKSPHVMLFYTHV